MKYSTGHKVVSTCSSFADGGKVKKPPLGSGERFKAVARSATAGGARNPNAVAAAAGIKKYGKKRMAQMAAAGRKKA